MDQRWWMPQGRACGNSCAYSRANAGWTVLLTLAWTLLQTAFFAQQLHFLRDSLARSSLRITTTQDDLTTWLVLFVLLWFCEYLVTLVHEGGHFVVGWLLGFELHFFQVGPLKLVRARDGFRLRLDPGSLSGGAVAAYPFSSRLLRLRWVLAVAAGPLASALFGVAAWRLLLGYLAPCQFGSALSQHGLLSALTGNADPLCLAAAISGGSALSPLLIGLLALLAWEAVVSGLLNLVLPYIGKHGVGDGFRLFRLLTGMTSGAHDLVELQLYGCAVFAVRPREWPGELVLSRLALAETPRDRHLAFFCAYYWALDSGAFPRAGEYLDQALVTCPTSPIPSILALEAAYFEARYRGNSAGARDWLRRGGERRGRAEPILRPRAQAAILLLEGQYQVAEARVNQGLDALGQRLLADDTLPEQWMQEEEEQLRQMLAEAQQAQGIPTHQRSVERDD